MNIYAKNGDKVKFAHPENGYEADVQAAAAFLDAGAIYTVKQTIVHGFHTDVELWEVPTILFNSVQFEDVTQKPIARIENWTNIGNAFLVGKIQDHPRQHEFHAEYQFTSRIVFFDEETGVCETRNTIYKLGKKAGAASATAVR